MGSLQEATKGGFCSTHIYTHLSNLVQLQLVLSYPFSLCPARCNQFAGFPHNHFGDVHRTPRAVGQVELEGFLELSDRLETQGPATGTGEVLGQDSCVSVCCLHVFSCTSFLQHMSFKWETLIPQLYCVIYTTLWVLWFNVFLSHHFKSLVPCHNCMSCHGCPVTCHIVSLNTTLCVTVHHMSLWCHVNECHITSVLECMTKLVSRYTTTCIHFNIMHCAQCCGGLSGLCQFLVSVLIYGVRRHAIIMYLDQPIKLEVISVENRNSL